MKLRSKVLIVTNESGNEINLEEKEVVLALNGERLDTKLQDVCSDMEFDDGEVYGNTLLSYYGIQPDGSLQVDGSNIQLIDAATGDKILVKEMKRPSVHDDTEMPFEHLLKFIEYFKIAKPEEVFHNLSKEEKQALADDRTAAQDKAMKEAEKSRQENESAKSQADEAAAAQAEADLKASIHPDLIRDQKDYNAIRSFYSGIDFKEYIKENIHLFYGKDENNPPSVLIKRGKAWWEECQEPDVLEETDTNLVISYLDGEVSKRLNLDIESGDVTIEDDKA